MKHLRNVQESLIRLSNNKNKKDQTCVEIVNVARWVYKLSVFTLLTN